MKDKPIVYVIAGPNGSGKTSFAKEFLPNSENCREFVSPDAIAVGLSPFAPVSAQIRAGRLVLARINELAARHQSFGFETTLSGRSYKAVLKDLKKAGYEIRIYFILVRSVELALKRIAERVAKGGHSVPELDVRRRYKRTLWNLFNVYQHLADVVVLIDNSAEIPEVVAIGNSFGYWSDEKGVIEQLKKEVGIRKEN